MNEKCMKGFKDTWNVVIAVLFALAMVVLAVAWCGTAEANAATVTRDGIVYRTEKVKGKRWVDGGPNYRYQATLVKVIKCKRKHYVVPWSVKRKKHSYVVTQVVGDPFKACKRARSISVWAPLAYVEDMTFWRADERYVDITVRNWSCYDYLRDGSTANLL